MCIYWLSETDIRKLIEKLCNSILEANQTVSSEIKKLGEEINRVNNNVKSDGCNSQSEQNTKRTVDDKYNEFSNTDRSCVEKIIEQKLVEFRFETDDKINQLFQELFEEQEKARTKELECVKEELKKEKEKTTELNHENRELSVEKEKVIGQLERVKDELTAEKIKTKELECVKEELKKEKEKTTELNNENRELSAEKERVIGQLERVKDELTAEKIKTKELECVKEELKKEKEKVIGQLERVKDELTAEVVKTNELDRMKEKLSKKIIDVNQELEEERKKSSNLELRNKEYEKEKEDTMRQLNELTIQKEQVAGVVGKYEEINSSYKSLLEKVIKCESMKDFSLSKGLDEIYKSDSPEKILEFRSIVGNEYSFAIDVCNALKNFKKKSENPQPVTQDELELIDGVNEFYRKREKRTDESDKLLYLPKGFNADNVSEARVPFLSSEMMDISNPLENQFEYISDVYTPCFKKYDSISPLVKALVKGRLKG